MGENSREDSNSTVFILGWISSLFTVAFFIWFEGIGVPQQKDSAENLAAPGNTDLPNQHQRVATVVFIALGVTLVVAVMRYCLDNGSRKKCVDKTDCLKDILSSNGGSEYNSDATSSVASSKRVRGITPRISKSQYNRQADEFTTSQVGNLMDSEDYRDWRKGLKQRRLDDFRVESKKTSKALNRSHLTN